MVSKQVNAATAGGIAVEEALSWTIKIVAGGAGWLGIYCLALAAGWVDSYSVSKAPLNVLVCLSVGGLLILVAFILLNGAVAQHRHRLRLVVFPNRNYAEISSKHKSPQPVPFSSIAILRYSVGTTFIFLLLSGGWALIGLRMFLGVWRNVTFFGLGNGFAVLGAPLIGGALLASIVRDRIFHRVLLFPPRMPRRMLITKREAKTLSFPVHFGL